MKGLRNIFLAVGSLFRWNLILIEFLLWNFSLVVFFHFQDFSVGVLRSFYQYFYLIN